MFIVCLLECYLFEKTGFCLVEHVSTAPRTAHGSFEVHTIELI